MPAYPTMEAVEQADNYQLCYWRRFLSSPGMWAVNLSREEFEEALDAEVLIMNRIMERSKELGGFTPEISKSIGWDAP